jgi:Protein of unknown function (DUF3105)
LAKKARTPPPPRRSVQAPKQRSAERTPAERRTRLWLALFSLSGFVILGALIAFVALGSGGDGGKTTGISSDDCTERSFPGLEPRHLSNPAAKVKYNSFPPSSGPHYQTPAAWNIYEDPIRQTILVHNLEHGGIVIQYGPDVSEDEVDKLRSFWQDDPNGLVVAPNPELGAKFALTAWNTPEYPQDDLEDAETGNGYVLTCTKFDGDTFAEFRDERRNKAGERFPSVDDMAPGTQ